MPIGFTTYLVEEREFVDREAFVQAFRENIQNSEIKDYNVLFYYGVAGIGKSKLQKELQKILDEEYPEIFWTSIDLDTETYREIGTFLFTLRNKIQEKYKAKFYLFNTAHAIYRKKLHPEIALLKENYPMVKEGWTFNKIIDILNVFGPAKLAWDAVNNAPDSVVRFFKEQVIDINKLTNMEAHEIEKLLPVFFAADITNYLGTNSKAYIFIDTYEALFEDLRKKGSLYKKNEWIRDNLIPSMPTVSWVICGREEFMWDPKRHPECEMYLEKHLIDGLPDECCREFLKKCSIKNKDIQDIIIEASKGVPFYLNLSVDTYEKIKMKEEREPALEDFGKAQPEIFDRFAKYLDDNEIRALEVLSAPNLWDRDLFNVLIKKFDPGFPAGAFSELIKFSFIKRDSNEKYSIHQLMRNSLQEHQDPVDRKNVHDFMFEHYNSKLKSITIKTITSEQEKALKESFYHAKESVKAEDLLNWFVTASEPFNKAALWQLIAPIYEDMLQFLKEKLGSEHPDIAETLNNLALLYESMGEYEKALTLYQRALEIRENLLGPEHLDVAIIRNNLASLYDSMGEYSKALPLYKRVLDIREKVLDPKHLDIATTLNNLALLYYHMKECDKALPLYQRSLEIREEVLGPEHLDIAITLNNLGLLYESRGEYDKALPLYQRDLEISEKILGPEHPDVSVTLNNLGLLHDSRGEYDKALPLYQRALDIREKTLGPQHPEVATTLNNLARLYRHMGEDYKALPLYQRAFMIVENMLDPSHPNTLLIKKNLDQVTRDIEEKKEN